MVMSFAFVANHCSKFCSSGFNCFEALNITQVIHLFFKLIIYMEHITKVISAGKTEAAGKRRYILLYTTCSPRALPNASAFGCPVNAGRQRRHSYQKIPAPF